MGASLIRQASIAAAEIVEAGSDGRIPLIHAVDAFGLVGPTVNRIIRNDAAPLATVMGVVATSSFGGDEVAAAMFAKAVFQGVAVDRQTSPEEAASWWNQVIEPNGNAT